MNNTVDMTNLSDEVLNRFVLKALMRWTDPHTDTTEEVYVSDTWDDGEALVCLVDRCPPRSIIVRTTDLMDINPDRK